MHYYLKLSFIKKGDRSLGTRVSLFSTIVKKKAFVKIPYKISGKVDGYLYNYRAHYLPNIIF
jgi:hypothetical protein